MSSADSPAPTGLLLSRDLFFNSKITGTAQALGHRITVAGSHEKALERLASESPRLVFADLGAGDLCSADALSSYIAAAPSATFIAFGSHVDPDSLRSARSAGCTEVMPRSRLNATLPDLIRQYLG